MRSGARFCDHCGSATSVPSTAAEYKQVTVLFADVVHSMEIAEAVGPERLRDIMSRLVDCTATAVRRYGGTLDKFTGDGIMALFGAPAALEDHALRACRAALDIQREIDELADEVRSVDGFELKLRIGLSSGRVITGEIGTATGGYTAVGAQVGMAQRMESIAPPGGVMVSVSTARLVEGKMALGPHELAHIKGIEDAVVAQRLQGVEKNHRRQAGAASGTLVGRDWEIAALTTMLTQCAGGRGSVVEMVGPAGIGKTRLVAETVRSAQDQGMHIFSTYCESHTIDVSFNVVARLLRDFWQVGELDAENARARMRCALPHADPRDLLLLDDLLGIAAPDVVAPPIDRDTRGHRLTTLINSAQLARTQPTLFVVEDVHWIDDVSASMIAEFISVGSRTNLMVLLTYRPEYRGVLRGIVGARQLRLQPLSMTDTSALVTSLLGDDPSVSAVSVMIGERAAGNPFFIEEVVRELAERGVLEGDCGSYVCTADPGEVNVPATLEATLAARIDRLSSSAKRTLRAAAVIGSRFRSDLLSAVGIESGVEELITADLIEKCREAHSLFAFRHPLIRAVAYESLLTSDRARLHRRLAQAIESREPDALGQNAALIAEHFELAGDLHAAYGWRMKAAEWASARDMTAARSSWERAITIADALPYGEPAGMGMRIVPRTLLCQSGYRGDIEISDDHFDELQQLCTASGDKKALFIAMTALVMRHVHLGRVKEASELASDAMALIGSIEDPPVGVFGSLPLHDAGSSAAQLFVDGADWTTGHSHIESPLALALAHRASARFWTGRPGWSDDLNRSLDMARSADPVSFATVVSYVYLPAIPLGVRRADDRAVADTAAAVEAASRCDNALVLTLARATHGLVLLHRSAGTGRARGQQLLRDVIEAVRGNESSLREMPILDVYLAREQSRMGRHDIAVPMLRDALDQIINRGQLVSWGAPATGVLVDVLVERAAGGDAGEATAAIERLATAAADGRMALRDIWLVRMRARLALAQGDFRASRELAAQYRRTASALGFDGHIGWAEEMPTR